MLSDDVRSSRLLLLELALLSLCLIGWAVGVALSGNHQNGLAIGFGSFIVVASLPMAAKYFVTFRFDIFCKSCLALLAVLIAALLILQVRSRPRRRHHHLTTSTTTTPHHLHHHLTSPSSSSSSTLRTTT